MISGSDYMSKSPHNLKLYFLSFLSAFQISEKPWYETVWFLALCALAGLLILFLLVVCCCRGYGKNRTVYVRQREPLATKKRFGVRGEEQEFSDFPPNLKPSTTKLDPVSNGYRMRKSLK